jgi:hypothetical protein
MNRLLVATGLEVLNVKANDAELNASRETVCNRVLERFEVRPAGTRLLCFIDDVDFAELQTGSMKGNRGFFVPQLYSTILRNHPPLPQYVRELYDRSHMLGGAYRSLVYIHGSTCDPTESLILILAHELEHFTQFAKDRHLYEADFLLKELRGNTPDLPSESDALLASKRIAVSLCGETCVDSYARDQLGIAEESDRPKWEYLLALSLDDARTFADKVRQQCRDNSSQLNAMILANSPRYEQSFPRFDFSKPEWWEE